MSEPAGRPTAAGLPPWPAPDGGFERVMRPSRRERRRQPLTRRSVVATRVAFLLCAAGCAVALTLGGAKSLPGVIVLAVSTCIQVMLLTAGQRRQLLGLDPPEPGHGIRRESTLRR